LIHRTLLKTTEEFAQLTNYYGGAKRRILPVVLSAGARQLVVVPDGVQAEARQTGAAVALGPRRS